MKFSEVQFNLWSASPSSSETERMNNAESAVRKAIAASDKLQSRNIKVFAQGSYRNRVNVRKESDVDVCVLCKDVMFWTGGPPGSTLASMGLTPATYSYADFRSEVGQALRSYFNTGTVTEGDKAFDISGNTYRVEADVAPFFTHRRYAEDMTSVTGIQMIPKSGEKVINWPDQHHKQGNTKNAATRRGFKGCTRILKTLRYKMLADGSVSAGKVPSFLVECLIYNVPNEYFGSSTWSENLKACLVYIYENTKTDADCNTWLEVSRYKWLFRPTQPWKRADVNTFIADCWRYVGYS